MSDDTGPTPLESAKSTRSKQLVRQLSKSLQKGREAVKRGLLTPRGPRASNARGVVVDEVPPAPKVQATEQDVSQKAVQVSSVDTSGKVDAAPTDVKIKATVKPSGDDSAPAELALTPSEEPSLPAEVTGPATPAAAPTPKSLHTEDAAGPEVPPISDAQLAGNVGGAADAKHEDAEIDADTVAQTEDLGIAPPNVRVIIKGIPEDDGKATVAVTPTPTPPQKTSPVEQAKKGHKGRNALLGLLAVTTASIAAVVVKGMQAH